MTREELNAARLLEDTTGLAGWAESDLPHGAKLLARSVLKQVKEIIAENERLRTAVADELGRFQDMLDPNPEQK